jgi:enoyl-CoA hydratase/carnithine racemase
VLELSRDGDIHIITMNDGKNTVQPAFVARMNALLDEVEAESDGPSALVLTGTDKFFCNGLDIGVVMSLQGDDRRAFGEGMSRLTRRLLAGPIPTIAAALASKGRDIFSKIKAGLWADVARGFDV